MTMIFTPTAATVSRTTSSSSARVAIGTFGGGSSAVLRIASPSDSALCFVEFGDVTAAAAVATSFPMLPGTVEVFQVGPNTTYVAAITSSGTGTLYITPGQGR